MARTSVEDLARFGGEIVFQSPRAAELAEPVRRLDGTFTPGTDGRVRIRGVSRFLVGDLAADRGIPVHWLDERPPSLEDFYLSVAEEEFPIP